MAEGQISNDIYAGIEIIVWDKFLEIEVINENHKEKGVSRITINDEEINGNLIPFDMMKEHNTVRVFMQN